MNNIHLNNITFISGHKVGNKLHQDPLFLTDSLLELEDDTKENLLSYFSKPFKSSEYFNLFHESDLHLNEVYVYAGKIFDNPNSLHEQSVHLAKHLYECTDHPNIKPSEFYVVFFKDCVLDGLPLDAIGLFKSENKDTFLKVKTTGKKLNVISDEGVNINKLDKGCLIFNSEKEKGFIVAVVDHTNKGSEAQYWIDDFLHLEQRKDEYFNTQNVITLCKNYITKEMPVKFESNKADQADMLNKSVKYFKDHEEFNFQEFSKEVIGQGDIIDDFIDFKQEFQKNRSIEIEDQFMISESAFKKQAKVFKSILKLDKNFHIYIHGNKDLIESGVDENGRKFYKIYYQEEH